jgi:aldose 1-epimerase
VNLILKNKFGDSAEIDLSSGGAITKLLIDGETLIKYPLKENDKKKGYPSAVLFPFPNRIKDGKYEFENIEYSLELNDIESHNAIHGLVAFETFELISHTETKAICKFTYKGYNVGYPFPFDISLTYSLKRKSLSFSVEIINTGETNMPYGFGWHPYFGFSDESITGMTLKVPNRKNLELNDRFLPTSEFKIEKEEKISLKNTMLDNVYQLENVQTVSEVILKWKKKELKVSQKTGKDKLNYLVLSMPSSRDCIAIEPQTCSTDAFNNGDGLLILKKGKKTKFDITVSMQG